MNNKDPISFFDMFCGATSPKLGAIASLSEIVDKLSILIALHASGAPGEKIGTHDMANPRDSYDYWVVALQAWRLDMATKLAGLQLS